MGYLVTVYAYVTCDVWYGTLQKDELYLNLVLDFIPETVYRVIRHHSKAKQIMPLLYIKVFCMHLLFEFPPLRQFVVAQKHMRDFIVHVYYLCCSILIIILSWTLLRAPCVMVDVHWFEHCLGYKG